MKIEGSIKIVSPELKNQEIFIEKEDQEFILNLEEGEKKEVKSFGVFTFLANDEIEISNDVGDTAGIEDSVNIHIVNPKSEDYFGFTISVKQARVLVDILQKYIDCYYAYHALAKPQKVNLV